MDLHLHHREQVYKKRVFTEIKSFDILRDESTLPATKWQKTTIGRKVVGDPSAAYKLQADPQQTVSSIKQPLTIHQGRTTLSTSSPRYSIKPPKRAGTA